jgi:hypothetical protein
VVRADVLVEVALSVAEVGSIVAEGLTAVVKTVLGTRSGEPASLSSSFSGMMESLRFFWL